MPLSPLTSPFILYLVPFFLRCIVVCVVNEGKHAGSLSQHRSCTVGQPLNTVLDRPKNLHKTVSPQWRPFKQALPDKCACVREKAIVCVCVAMAFTLSEIMAARRQQQQSQRGGRGVVEVDEYSSNPTQAFTFYNINQGRFQPPHVHMVDPLPHDSPKPPGYTRFVCISDTHSRTDTIQMPYGDVLLHAGDFTELGLPSEVKKFNDWLGTLPYEIKIVIAGNHELTFDQEFMADLIKQDFYYFPSASKLKPENYENVQSLLTNCIYLQDSDVTVMGFRIYGSPWQPWYYGWGFNLPRGQALLDKWNQIPDSTDILLTHCPPLGFLDWVPRKMQRVGCMELLNTVQRRVQPKLHVFGHIHEGYGMMTDGTTTFVNASACTVNFQPMNPPIVFDLPNPRSS
uniref:Metallophosphoesterase domain containing 1 n=1 Tax=Cyprinus carpio TaxID=7962 RepID=A0A8C2IZL2_CYPCA